ncbi:MAG: methionyl-tRNA formyltransferase [Flavobacteriia bacterium]|nr:methionyl-tRNA formyltransferase [Flavobacteriia bacterium]OJX39256.1 MAG: methionyl-tRNA formyltransferase [Flavobacteriia bacterium 40-80]
MNLYILLSEKKWHKSLFVKLQKKYQDRAEWLLINNPGEFTLEKLDKLNPDKIFIPHWSYIIDRQIYEKYKCIVFHMTDLPYGRGGSPLQNLIIRGLKRTKITAIKVNQGIDSGDIYLKKNLSLDGTAREIFERAVPVIQKMIIQIIEEKIIPQPQTGEVVLFNRRKPEEGNINDLKELEKIYDYIRMLDCEGYPKAFIETENFKIDFSKAQFNQEQNYIDAHVRIYKK